MNDLTAPAALATPAPEVTLATIDQRTKRYAEAREHLAALVTELNAGIQALQRAQLPAVRKAVQRASEHHARLNEALSARPDLFKRPRTTIFHGVVVGYKKGKATFKYDADFVIKQIKLRLPLKQDSLIRVEEKVVAEGLKLLTDDERAKIGVTLEEGKDAVVITPTDSAIDKAVNALLAAAIDEKTNQQEEA